MRAKERVAMRICLPRLREGLSGLAPRLPERLSGVLFVFFGILLAATPMAQTPAAVDTPTFHKNVVPILQKNCQTCHRPGEVAPMSLLTYEQTRPWARAIKAAVAARTMPPWFADPGYGDFENERRLTSREIETISAWVDAGAPAGKEADAPPPLEFENGWNITPDVIVEMPKPFQLPARGTINYKYVRVETNFAEDMWRSEERRVGKECRGRR